jgi:LPS sulfotransferase NodH
MIFEKHDKMKRWQFDLFTNLSEGEPTPTTEIHKTICVISTPRSGSTYLCELLNNTRQFGHIEEWLNNEYFYAWQQVTGLDFTLEKYLTWVIEHSSFKGVFGIHWHIAQIFAMMKDFNFGLNNFKFDHILYVRRQDKIAQAVSLAKALKSNSFRSYEPMENFELPRFDEIAHALYLITQHEASYDSDLIADEHHQWWYEEFQNNPGAIDEIVRSIGGQRQDTYTSQVQVQRTANTRQLTTDFKAYLQGAL